MPTYRSEMGDTLLDHLVEIDKKHEWNSENHVEDPANNLGDCWPMESHFSSTQLETGKFSDENGMDSVTILPPDMNTVSRRLHPDSQDIVNRERESQAFDDAQDSSNLMSSAVESQLPKLEHEEPSIQLEMGKVCDENGMDTVMSLPADMHIVSRRLHPDSQDIVDTERESQSFEERSWLSTEGLIKLESSCASSNEPSPILEHEEEEPSIATCKEKFLAPVETREVANAVSVQTISGNGELEEVFEGLANSLCGDGDLEEECEKLVQSHECLKPPERGSDSFVESNMASRHSHGEFVVPTSTTEENKSASEANGVREALIPHTNTGDGNQELDSFRLPSEEDNTTGLVSTVLEEWQHFDSETYATTSDHVGFVHTPLGGHTRKGLEMWEELLEDGSSEKDAYKITSHAEVEVGIDSPSHDRIPFWLPSPGNPFVENLERVSNFSEAEGFMANGSLPSHVFEAETSLPFKEGQLHFGHSNGGLVPGISYTMHGKLEEENLSNERDGHGSKRQWQARFPSFSDIRSSSKSHYLDSLPALEVSKEESRLECGGEKWEAVFDSPPLTSAAHEVGRSLSLPREADERRGKRADASIFKEWRSSGFASPKFSPLVKKVVSKIRTTPDKVLSMGSKARDKKEHKTPMWRSCLCCFHA